MQIGDVIILLSGGVLFVLWFLLLLNKVKKQYSTILLSLHLIGVFFAVGLLYSYIFQDKFEYFYVWGHSSLELPFVFKISCLWEGQEGSFLLWIFWNAIIAFGLGLSKNNLVNRSLLFFIPIQLVLFTMILGWEFPAFDVEVGSSPFALLKDKIHSEVYKIKPDFIPSDGTGMNALLQNYWMVIHPPVIFLGFAVSSVPFCLCLTGLLKKETISSWTQKAFFWVVLSVVLIGVGMIMGAYWAYETLNFGGFWNWDPVENAIYVPWLIQIVVLHLLVIFKNNKNVLKILSGLTVTSFLLVLYSTFLTRSGILGDTSVHAFTDLGLSGQLMCFLVMFVLVSVVVILRAQRFFPKQNSIEEVSFKTFDFWLLMGVLILALAAFQVLLSTSFPVFNELGKLIGFDPNLAPPVDQVEFYTKFQLWFALGVLISMTVAQMLYWRKSFSTKWIDILFIPTVGSALLSVLFLWLFDPENFSQIISGIIVITAVVFNLFLFLAKYTSLSKSSGSISHLGFGVMLLGILISQGYKKVVTDEQQFGGKLNSAGNVLLMKGKKVSVGEFDIQLNEGFYKSKEGTLIKKSKLEHAFNPSEMVFNQDASVDGKNYKKGDAIKLNKENVFYSVTFASGNYAFNILPRVQFNKEMGVIPSPDIDHRWNHDIYTHVSNFPDDRKKPSWENANSLSLRKGERWVYGDKILELTEVEKLKMSNDSTLCLQAHLKYSSVDTTYVLKPVFIKGDQIKVIEDNIAETGFKVVFDSVNEDNSFGFSFLSTPSEWITIKSVQFPFISLVWLGAIVMIFGLTCSLFFKVGWFVNYKPKKIKIGSVATSTIKLKTNKSFSVKH